MKNFFKKNLLMIILVLISIVCLFLSIVSIVFLSIGTAGLGAVFIFYALKQKKKYDNLIKQPQTQNYFDATTLDYDEDIYYIGASSPKKEMSKGALQKMSALSPLIILGFFGIAFLFISLTTLAKMIF